MVVESHAILVASGTSVQANKTVLPKIKQIDAGIAHTMMLLETGEIFTWGDNYYGQLGLGYASRRNTPHMFYVTRLHDTPEMIDKPTRVKKFDFVQETVVNSLTTNVTVTGYVSLRIDTRKTTMDDYLTDFARVQDHTGRGQRDIHAGTKLIWINSIISRREERKD
jgi:hypothetical protein